VQLRARHLAGWLPPNIGDPEFRNRRRCSDRRCTSPEPPGSHGWNGRGAKAVKKDFVIARLTHPYDRAEALGSSMRQLASSIPGCRIPLRKQLLAEAGPRLSRVILVVRSGRELRRVPHFCSCWSERLPAGRSSRAEQAIDDLAAGCRLGRGFSYRRPGASPDIASGTRPSQRRCRRPCGGRDRASRRSCGDRADVARHSKVRPVV